MDEMALDSLAKYIRRNDLVVLAGAGISFAPPSCAPLFRKLRDDLLRAFTISLKGHISEHIEEACRQLFHTADSPRGSNEPVPEVLFEALDTILPSDLYRLLRIQLLRGYPNAQHRFVAGLLGRGIRLLITTNFEDYFEQALKDLKRTHQVFPEGKSIRASARQLLTDHQSENMASVWKPHGTLEVGQEDSIRVTLSQVARERHDVDKQRSLVDVFERYPTLVIGYSGYDHDITPTFRQASAIGPGLYWLSYAEPRPGDPCLSILASWGNRGHLLVGNIAELFSRLEARLGLQESSVVSTSDCSKVYQQRDTDLINAVSQLPLILRFYTLAILTYQLTRPAIALELIAQIKRLYDKGEQYVSIKPAYILESNIFNELSQYDALAKSLVNLERAINPQDWEDLALLRHLQGELALGKGEFLHAREYYEEALKASYAGNSTHMEATVLQSMAVLHAYNEQWEQARQCLNRVSEISSEQGERIALVKVLHELGIIAIESNQLDEAEAYFEEVIRQSQDLGHADLLRSALYEQATIAKRGKEYSRAQNLLNRSRELAHDLRNDHGEAICLLALADLAYEQGMGEMNADLLEDAAERYTDTINYAQAIRAPEVEANALAGRGRCHALLQNSTGLLHDLSAMKRMLERWPAPFLTREIALLEKAIRMNGLDSELNDKKMEDR